MEKPTFVFGPYYGEMFLQEQGREYYGSGAYHDPHWTLVVQTEHTTHLYGWHCQKCGRIARADTMAQDAAPEHVHHRGCDIGSCHGEMKQVLDANEWHRLLANDIQRKEKA